MLSDSAKVEDVPLAELLREVAAIMPAGICLQLYVQAIRDAKACVRYELWGVIGPQAINHVYTVSQVLNFARRESDRIQSERLRHELDAKAAAEIAGMA